MFGFDFASADAGRLTHRSRGSLVYASVLCRKEHGLYGRRNLDMRHKTAFGIIPAVEPSSRPPHSSGDTPQRPERDRSVAAKARGRSLSLHRSHIRRVRSLSPVGCLILAPTPAGGPAARAPRPVRASRYCSLRCAPPCVTVLIVGIPPGRPI